MEKKVIICVGRQYGSGGKQLGRRLAEILGIDFYDKEIVAEMSKQTGMDEEYLKKHDEQAPGFFEYAMTERFGTTRLSGASQTFVALNDTIKKLAAEKSCVFVGRSADYILRDEPNLIKIFIHAPYKYRVRFIAKKRNVSVEEADNLIQKHDGERSRFYDFFTDKTWGQVDSSDLSVDVSKLGEEDTLQFIADYVRRRMEKF